MPASPNLETAEIEAAIAAEAAAHARAAEELNPFGEAEAREMGSARLVYAGTFSPVHGVYGLGLDGPVEERDWEEIERFFQKKERAPHYWITPFTDASVLERIQKTHRPTRKEKVSGWAQLGPAQSENTPYLSGPDHEAWCLAFTRARNPEAQEADLLALTKLHQKNTRFHLAPPYASYTFFHQGIALLPYPSPSLLERQKIEAASFRSTAFVVIGELAPFLYERTLHEPV
jgi:hypothetical protein